MRILCDSREQKPFLFGGYDVQVERAALPTGDYSLPAFEDKIAVERKNGIDELVTCLSRDRDRFSRELARAQSFEYFAVIIEGRLDDIMAGRYRSRMSSNAVIESIAALSVRYRMAFLFCGNRAQAERMTYSLLSKYQREIEQKMADKRDQPPTFRQPEKEIAK
jgi:DNA excision repair protein ERCC-4